MPALRSLRIKSESRIFFPDELSFRAGRSQPTLNLMPFTFVHGKGVLVYKILLSLTDRAVLQ